MGFVSFEKKIKVDHVIREGESEDESNDSPLVELNSKFEFASICECKLISKVVESSKVDLSSNFEPAGVKSIPKVVESSKA
jgi:hypothetical protein